MKKREIMLVVILLSLVAPSFKSAALLEAPKFAEIYVNFDDSVGCNDEGEVVDEVREMHKDCSPPSVGCSLRSFEDENWNDEQCAGLVPGLVITQNYQENLFCGEYGPYENPLYPGTYYFYPSKYCPHKVSGQIAEFLWCKNIRTNDNNQYLCDNKGFWRKCSAEEGVLESVAWVDNILYNCKEDEDSDLPTWVKTASTDIDHDGQTTPSDCDDDPSGDPDFCPTDLTEQECQYPPHSRCAICINPSAPETCGDGVDNDCNSGTEDNCNKFAAGCEQKSFHDLNLEQESGESGTATAGNAEDNDHDNEGEVDINTIRHFNAQGESFSWTATSDGGYCCGYNGIEDLGKTVYSEAGGGSRVCLNTEENLVGREGEIPNCDGDGDWCWG